MFADGMILYVENPTDTTRKLLDFINEFSKLAGYKINTQKSLAFLYTNNERAEREIKGTVPFTITSKRMKYLAMNLPKETEALYSENCDMLMKHVERQSMFLDWKSQYYQNAIPSKAICRFNAVPKNYQWHFFIELEQKNLKILWRYKRP